jgi:hypothetical protein
MKYAYLTYRIIVEGAPIAGEEQHKTSNFFPNVFFSDEGNTFVFADAKTVYEKEFGGNVNYKTGYIVKILDSASNVVPHDEYTATLTNGAYSIEYYISYSDINNIVSYTLKATYNFSVLENKLPLKKYTITDCVIRCLELAEPLKVISSTGSTANGDLVITAKEKPRFTFDGVEYSADGLTYTIKQGSQAEKYDKILAPTFTMTKATLREQLQQIGGFIHAEPRLKNGVIYFDEYGGNKYASIAKKKHISANAHQNVNEFCTSLDSSADNLINRLDYAQGVIVEPFSGGHKTLRCEQTTLKVEDTESSFISTQRPIMEVIKLEGQAFVKGSTTEFTPWVDLSSCLYEQADYLNLNSYAGFYPYAKAYALYYTQGQKNIRGLFFKNPDAINAAWFQNYAIVNCFKLNGYEIDENNYPAMRFRVSYIPLFNARIHTNKALVTSSKPRTLAYNQSANFVETRYYGENLKGVIARLGNVEKQYTYKVAYLTDIPKAGELFDDDYYISAVSCEYHTTYIKVTVGLSKDFNRLSEYIGISSDVRMWEVSEKQAYSRDTVYNEYVVVSFDDKQSDKDILACKASNVKPKRAILSALTGEAHDSITEAVVYGLSKKGKKVTSYGISLPVVSTAFGNSLMFSFNYEDNYSAGQKVVQQGKAYLSNYVPYCDFYGRFYYLAFALKAPVLWEQTADGLELPQRDNANLDNAYFSTSDYAGNETPYIYRKNGGEVPSVNVQIHFVTNDKTCVIGSGMASNCALVTGKTSAPPKLYILPERLNKFSLKLDTTNLEGVEISDLGTESDDGISSWHLFDEIIAKTNGKSWAIVTAPEVITESVEDEDGNPIQQSVDYGSKLILGRNVDVIAGEKIALPYFIFKHQIYK